LSKFMSIMRPLLETISTKNLAYRHRVSVARPKP
jgi:hypothetical protein